MEDLTKETPEFIVSRGALKAVEMLNDATYKKTFLDKIITNEEVIFAYRLYFQLFDFQELLCIKKNQEFFNKACDYFIEKSNGRIGKKS